MRNFIGPRGPLPRAARCAPFRRSGLFTPQFFEIVVGAYRRLHHMHDDSAEVVGDPATQRFSVEYRADGRLVAVDAVNDARAHMTARRRIAEACASPEPPPG